MIGGTSDCKTIIVLRIEKSLLVFILKTLVLLTVNKGWVKVAIGLIECSVGRGGERERALRSDKICVFSSLVNALYIPYITQVAICLWQNLVFWRGL